MKRKVINIIALVLLLASVVVLGVGKMKITGVLTTHVKEIHFSSTGFQALFSSVEYYGILGFVIIINIVLCIASMLTKSKKKDPAIHVIFPLLSLLPYIYVMIKVTGQAFADYSRDNFGMESKELLESAILTENINTFEICGNVALGLFFIFIIVCFIKRSRFIVGLADEAPVVVQMNTEPVKMSAMDELTKYKDLLDSGVITQEEFDAKKKQLLGL